MRKTVLIRLTLVDPEKSPAKALRTVTAVNGVDDAKITGEERNVIEVIGEGLDIAELVRLLRERVGDAELVSPRASQGSSQGSMRKIVFRIGTVDPAKSRKKAMKIVATWPGVYSIALKGDNRDQLEVVGEGMDTVEIVKLLRKKIGYTEVLSVPAKRKIVEEFRRPYATINTRSSYQIP